MRFTAQEEYGLRCMVQLARHEGGKPVTIQAIAHSENITPAYVGKLMMILRRGHLVDGLHGPAGGYVLSRPAREITVGDVLGVLDGRLFEAEACRKTPDGHLACIHTSECAVRSLWATLDLLTSRIVDKLKLSDLVRPEQSLAQLIRDEIPGAMEMTAARAAGGTR